MLVRAFQFGKKRVCGGKSSEEIVRIRVNTIAENFCEIRHLCAYFENAKYTNTEICKTRQASNADERGMVVLYSDIVTVSEMHMM